MNDREKELKEIYDDLKKESIKERGNKLLGMLSSGKVKPTERDKLGLCPFLFAIDSSFDMDTIKKLVKDAGCNIKSTDAEGDTALHYAVNLERKELE